MANSANPEINKKIATSALGTLVIATVFFYLGDRYAETLVTYPGQIFDHLSDAFLSMWQTIKDAPFALDMTSNSLLFGGACFLIIWMIWLRYVAFIGNYRSGEESGSARWGTVKEGKKFKDLQTEDTAVADGDGMTGSGIPTREEVRSHFAEMGFAVDPDRFFDVNEGRGWRTNSGKPVDDWKKLAAVWDRNEHPKTATPLARTEPKANAVGKIPSVEEVMAKWGCDRETAQGYIDENMY